MTESANIYGILLLSSFLTGIFLHIILDLLGITKTLIFHNSANKSNIFLKSQKSAHQKALVPLTQKRTFRESFDILYPHNEHAAEKTVTVFLDIIFALVASVSIILLLFAVNNGIMRGFVIPVCICGAILYHFTLSKPLSAILYTAAFLVIKTALKPVRIILLPLMTVFSRLVKAIKHLFKKLPNKIKANPRRNTKSKADDQQYNSNKHKNRTIQF